MQADDSQNSVYERAREALARAHAAEAAKQEERAGQPGAESRAQAASTAVLPAVPVAAPRTAESARQRRSRVLIPVLTAVFAAGCLAGWIGGAWRKAPKDTRPVAMQTMHTAPQANMAAGPPVSQLGQAKPSPDVPGRRGAVALKSRPVVMRADSHALQSPPAVESVAHARPSQPVATVQADWRSDSGVENAVERWRAALLSNNADTIAPAYASRVERYFLRTDVDRSFVRKYMQRQEASGTRLTDYSLRKLAVTPMQDGAVEVDLVVSFAVSTRAGKRMGQTRTQLKMRQEDGSWKIFSERDFHS